MIVKASEDVEITESLKPTDGNINWSSHNGNEIMVVSEKKIKNQNNKKQFQIDLPIYPSLPFLVNLVKELSSKSFTEMFSCIVYVTIIHNSNITESNQQQ